MNPEDMPRNVWKWLSQQAPPFLMIVTSHILGSKMYFDDDPEAVDVVSKAYEEVMKKRIKEKMKKK